MLISLIYVSSASHLMSNEELLEILRVSRKNNESRSITGMLLYKGGNFMQVLEGPRESVMEIFERIEKDNRHNEITVIANEPIEKRDFSEWLMAFVNLDTELAAKESAYSEFLQDELTAAAYRERPDLAYRMLLVFRENIR